MQIDSWTDDGVLACVIIEGQFFNAVPGSVFEGTQQVMAMLPMENECALFLWITEHQSVVSLFRHRTEARDIKGGTIVPTDGAAWKDHVECAHDLRTLLKQIGRMEVKT